MDYGDLIYTPGAGGSGLSWSSQANAGAQKSGSHYQSITGGQAAPVYPFSMLPPVSFKGSAYNFTVPDVAGLAAKYQTSLSPRFNALRDSRTSQLRADFDFLRNKEFERLNQRGAVGSGVENQQMGRFNDEYSRQFSEIDKELMAGQQKEAFDLASREAELRFKVQTAAAENRLNTEMARAETALKSGQLTIAERELYIRRIQQIINARDALLQRKNEFLGTQQGQSGGSSEYDGLSAGGMFGSSLDALTEGLSSGGGDMSDALTHLGTANKTFSFGNFY